MKPSDNRPQLAVVSPCSQCKNQRALPDDTNRNYCPRRHYQLQKQQLDAQGTDSTGLQHLVLTGRENLDQGNALANPVYWDAGNSILVWVARLIDNPAQIDSTTGAQANPDIMAGEGAFDTDFIVCQPLPVVPEASEADYFQQGRMKEWDPVVVVPAYGQAETDVSGVQRDTLFGGTARRTNLLYKSPRLPVRDHQFPEGS